MHQMQYDEQQGAWFGVCQGKRIRVDSDVVEYAQDMEMRRNLPPFHLNPAWWWNHRGLTGVTWERYQPEHNILEIVVGDALDVVPEMYRRAFPCTEFTAIKGRHFTIFQADLKGWATKYQLDALSIGYDHGDGSDFKLEHLLSAEDAESEE